MFQIENFQELNSPEHIVLTQHGRKRLAEREISIDDICKAISIGEIIEVYPDYYAGPCCLILGWSSERVLHICASVDEDFIYLISAYFPDPGKWEKDWKTRKGRIV